jgi:hypothetical protein
MRKSLCRLTFYNYFHFIFNRGCLAMDPNNGPFCSRRYRLATASQLTHSSKCSHILDWLTSKSKLYSYYDRRSVGQSVLVSSTHLAPKTTFLLLSDICGFVDVRRPPWLEDGSVVYNYYWSSPAQSFMTIFYYLRFESSLFVASYDSQGHDGGIRPRLHMG